MLKISWNWKTLLAVFVLFYLLSMLIYGGSMADAYMDEVTVGSQGQIEGYAVKVYVVALDNVSSRGVGNVSRMVEGIKFACQVESLHYRTEEGVWAEISFYVEVVVVRGWETYRDVVESACGVVVVNCHGETVPVPSGCTKEGWVEEIAEAMAYRNVTWAHTANYPFFYYYSQELGEDEWGEEGFQQLMSYIGKPNVTCRPPGPKTKMIRLNTGAEEDLAFGWQGFYDAFWVERGCPLNGSDFMDNIVLPIWGEEVHYATGAIVKYARNDTHTFGFYIHIGANQTYEYDGEKKSDRDFFRGYAAAGSAVYVVVKRAAAEDAISRAQKAIFDAEEEGRTKGLDEAEVLLQQAWDDYHREYYVGTYGGAIYYAKQAEEIAENSVEPSFIEANRFYLLALGAVGIGATVGVALLVRRKRNKKKDEAPGGI